MFFLTSCGYTPILSNKNSNFTIVDMTFDGNKKLNRIINNRLKNYINKNNEKLYSLSINTNFQKEISSKDSKNNPKTFRINIETTVVVQDEKENKLEKIFKESLNFNNDDDKFQLKKDENNHAKILVEKIAEDIIYYLQSI